MKPTLLLKTFLLTFAVSTTFATAAVDEKWRSEFNVKEFSPFATTQIGSGASDTEFDEPDAMIFVRHNPTWRGRLLASDIRFEEGQPSKSRMLFFDPSDAGASRVLAVKHAFGQGVFIGKPKSVVEDSNGRFFITDGIDSTDNVPDALRGKQGIHIFDVQLNHVKTFGQGVFESVNGIAIDAQNRIYVTERSKGVIRRFNAEGVQDMGWRFEDVEVNKTDNMLIAEDWVINGERGIIAISDEERGMVRAYRLSDGKFLDTLIGNAATCTQGDVKAKTRCFREQSLFSGNVEGMARLGNLLVLMDEADKPTKGKEDGGVLWFFDLRNRGIFNRDASGFRRNGSMHGLIGGIHKMSPHSQKAVEKNAELAAEIAPGTFISADSIDMMKVGDKRLLAVANQGLFRLEVFDLDAALKSLGVDAKGRAALLGATK